MEGDILALSRLQELKQKVFDLGFRSVIESNKSTNFMTDMQWIHVASTFLASECC